ncbi:glutamine--fructose-6-phosphate transaminase [Rhizobium sp. PP-CC-3A-592]|nr:glutamine--fructose-6-phosphate transaminase [Rhizobium sp. PP-CC-3A-592]
MCGIIGIASSTEVADRMLLGLKLLEYRGYDSAGLATLDNGRIHRCRAEGKLLNLEKKIKINPVHGHIGIAHTRWATHGAPTKANAHPHVVDGVAVVHNGIIENFSSIKRQLVAEGSIFTSQTDTEVIAQLLSSFRKLGLDGTEAFKSVLTTIRGAYALAVLFNDEPESIFIARSGPPLAIGYGNGEIFIGSDAVALSPYTEEVSYLHDGDWAVVSSSSVEIFDATNASVARPRHVSTRSAYVIDKGTYRHFMEKEIYEQPEMISHTLGQYIDFSSETVSLTHEINAWKTPSKLAISACGTAYLAGLVGKYWFEKFARLSVEIDVASEFRYRNIPFSADTAALFISQSGETADTLAALRYCKDQNMTITSLVNASESSIARQSDWVFPIVAGVEIGVASTKAFTCQLTVLAVLAIKAGAERGTISPDRERELVRHLIEMPRIMNSVLNSIRPSIEKVAREFSKCKDVLYIGRGTNFPLALEGALKLKEISYIHAEGYAAGELKHGPIALIDEAMPVVVIAPFDSVFEKTVSNMQEVAARGGRIVLITDEDGAKANKLPTLATIVIPRSHEIIAPMLFSLPIQLIAYHTAVILGADVDQPRNLAKSVTVE